MTEHEASIAEAFQTTLGLFETGVGIMRQNLRRADPAASDDEIDRRLERWLHTRPGAEQGDCAVPTSAQTATR